MVHTISAAASGQIAPHVVSPVVALLRDAGAQGLGDAVDLNADLDKETDSTGQHREGGGKQGPTVPTRAVFTASMCSGGQICAPVSRAVASRAVPAYAR